MAVNHWLYISVILSATFIYCWVCGWACGCWLMFSANVRGRTIKFLTPKLVGPTTNRVGFGIKAIVKCFRNLSPIKYEKSNERKTEKKRKICDEFDFLPCQKPENTNFKMLLLEDESCSWVLYPDDIIEMRPAINFVRHYFTLLIDFDMHSIISFIIFWCYFKCFMSYGKSTSCCSLIYSLFRQ